jgi:glutamyl-Q tRNA(Asp) synthetase
MLPEGFLMFETSKPTVGRFAPSPTGLMHFGSLVTAVASYCFARVQKGKWLVRMEDLDTPRNIPGAADAILRQLEHLGLHWDGEVVYQSTRLEFYAGILADLIRSGGVYRCICTRREIAAQARRYGNCGAVYSGRCRAMNHSPAKRGSWRVRVNSTPVEFTDLLHGRIQQDLEQCVGDYILKRTDGIFAYQFAAPVDDAEQEISQVIRGCDLLSSTPRQIYLLRQLGYAVPAYAHIPLILDRHGNKISKSAQQLHIIERDHPLPFGTPALFMALTFLGQSPPLELRHADPVDLMRWAVQNFNQSGIPLNNIVIDPEQQT